MSISKEKQLELGAKKCQGQKCGEVFEVTERWKNVKFCPTCICEAQSQMIRSYNNQFSELSKGMGPDFLKNLLIDLSEGQRPSEVALGDGTKGFVFKPHLFRIAKSAGNRRDRRNFEKNKKKKKSAKT